VAHASEDLADGERARWRIRSEIIRIAPQRSHSIRGNDVRKARSGWSSASSPDDNGSVP
jgi:hypothetical protein